MGGLISCRSSNTAASAALETMNARREVDVGSHRPPPWVSHGCHVRFLLRVLVAAPVLLQFLFEGLLGVRLPCTPPPRRAAGWLIPGPG